MEIGFDNKCLKTKKKSYGSKVITDFYAKKYLTRFSLRVSIIINDSLCKINKNYYPRIFLEECRYIE